MSRVTTTPLVVLPGSVAAPVVTTPATVWAWSAWTVLVAAVGTATQLAGAFCRVAAVGLWDLEFGVGAAGAEVGIGHLVAYQANPGNVALNVVLWPVPVDAVRSARLSVRARRDSTSSTVAVAALGYQGLDSDHVTTRPHQAEPAGANGVTVTPSGTAWANSAWVTLTTGFAAECAVTGVTLSAPSGVGQWEVDLGTGAPGAETVITTLRHDNGTPAGYTQRWLAGVRPVAAGTRLAGRLRKNDTVTTAMGLTLLYLDGTALLPSLTLAAAQSYVWGPL